MDIYFVPWVIIQFYHFVVAQIILSWAIGSSFKIAAIPF